MTYRTIILVAAAATLGVASVSTDAFAYRGGRVGAYHGGAYHFYRDSTMGANTFQSNLIARPKDDWRYNLWGGQLGGPIRIPKIYDGRNRTFFFLNYEGMVDLEPRFSIRGVPTAEQRIGDFSQTTAVSGAGRALITIYDPLTTNAASAPSTAK